MERRDKKVDEILMIQNDSGKEEDSVNESSTSIPEASNWHTDEPAHDALASCGRFSFLWLLVTTMSQFAIYLNKLYQDSAAVRKYFDERDVNFCAVSAFCLIMPAIIYVIYVVAVHIKSEPEATVEEVGTKVVHGMLLIPWQIKKRVELLQFAAERACYLRPLSEKEVHDKNKMEIEVSVLTFFETFYAGLTQILLQLYIVISSLDKKVGYSALTGELVASALCLISMLMSVRRQEERIFFGTGFFSVSGWVFIIISRSIAISQATTVIYGWMVIICIIHGLGTSAWITSVALKTYPLDSDIQSSIKRKMALFFLTFTVIGLPSLIFWPIMFDLRKRNRPAIFFLILFLENLVFVSLWMIFSKNQTWQEHDFIFVIVGASCFALGVAFIYGYIWLKPKYTDNVVYYDIKSGKDGSFGMFFKFSDVVFCIQRNTEVERELENIRMRKKDTELKDTSNLDLCVNRSFI